MADFSQPTKANIAIKQLLGKAQTDNAKAAGNEAEGIFFNVSSDYVFTQSINFYPSSAVTQGVAQLISGATLTLDATSNGHAYFATYPSWHPLTGQRIRNAISDAYGFLYQAKVYNGSSVQIPVGDQRAWLFQYQDGIFYQESGSTEAYGGSSLGAPVTITLYAYVGSTLTTSLSSLSSGSTSGISTEASIRASADTSLSTLISTEISNRISGETSLSTSLSTETSNRISGDTSLSTALSTSISTEASTRTSVDTSLSTQLSTDASTEASQIASLSAAIGTGAIQQLNTTNRGMIAFVTYSGNTSTGYLASDTGLTGSVVSGSSVKVFVNGIEVNCGNLTTDLGFFAPSGGTSTSHSNARVPGTEQIGDVLYWNDNAPYQLDNQDIIDYVYLVNKP
jgi:hypothetical protein